MRDMRMLCLITSRSVRRGGAACSTGKGEGDHVGAVDSMEGWLDGGAQSSGRPPSSAKGSGDSALSGGGLRYSGAGSIWADASEPANSAAVDGLRLALFRLGMELTDSCMQRRRTLMARYHTGTSDLPSQGSGSGKGGPCQSILPTVCK